MSYWDMGGYAMYVWPAYGITFVVLVLNILAAFVPSKEDES